MKGMGDIMRQAQMMQKKLAAAQQELETRRVEGQSGGGTVKAVVTGALELVDITINPAAIDPSDPAMLEDLVKAAVADAQRQAKALKESEMGKLTGGMNIPGLF